MLRKIASYFVAVSIALLVIAPPINYDIPLIINSFSWVYLIIVAGFFGFFLVFQDLHLALKVLVVYLFANCFLSQAPVESFNAYILVVACVYFFLLCKYCDYEIIINAVQAAFWFELFIALMQHQGLDRLTMFRNPDRTIYFGTVFQQMRLASLFAIMSPFLLLRSRWYLIPITWTCVLFGTLGYTYAIASGLIIYVILLCVTDPESDALLLTKLLLPGIFALLIFCTVRSWDHIHVEVAEGRLPVWWVVVKSWALDTTHPEGRPDWFGISQTGPFDLKRFLFGHGLDTFLPLFQYYKHDPNPFPQAHNDWLQLLWETGLVGFVIFTFWYCVSLLRRLWASGELLLLVGLTIISVNMFFAFPWRMTQTVLLMVAFVAFCEREGVY